MNDRGNLIGSIVLGLCLVVAAFLVRSAVLELANAITNKPLATPPKFPDEIVVRSGNGPFYVRVAEQSAAIKQE
jgi:hypothetical protein